MMVEQGRGGEVWSWDQGPSLKILNFVLLKIVHGLK